MSRHLPPGAKCTRCRTQATISLPSHHANFCNGCFLHFFRNAVRRAMKKFPGLDGGAFAVAVSGGKDSLAAWAVLMELGYDVKGIHIDLGIDRFSEASRRAIKAFASERGLPWLCIPLKDLIGWSMPEIRRRTRRKICSVCGMLKRQLLNRVAIDAGCRVLVTGHNLDDEAGRLLGNLVRNRWEYVEKQFPFLPSTHPKLPCKIKPLYRLSADEIRIYCRLSGIQPLEESCPFAKGATSHVYQEVLDLLERRMPGTKRDFLFSHLKGKKPGVSFTPFETCERCGQPCYHQRCSVCNFMDRIEEQKQDT